MHQTMDKTRAPASKTLMEIDLSESPYKNDMIHNRWHPDIPMVAWVKPGDDFVVQTYDWTGGFIQNDESADDGGNFDLPTFPSRSARSGSRARSRATSWWST